MSIAWLSGSSSSGNEARERLPLACLHCGNRCRIPASLMRAYVCPRCGHLLPVSTGEARGKPGARRVHAVWRIGRALRIPTLLLLTASIVIYVGLSSYRGAAPRAAAAPSHPALVRLTGAQERYYDYRLHQLELDLARDDQDFEVLIRLGQLHLQLGESKIEGRTAHLRRARYYLLRASMHTMFRPDAFLVRAFLEAANSPNPGFLLAGTPADGAPPSQSDEAWIRMRIGFLEEQSAYLTHSSRLLRRLAENYAVLYSLMDRSRDERLVRWEGGSTITDADEAKRLAELYFRRALAYARTHEARCRALHGLADLYRMTDEPARAASCLEELLALQPNNWLESLEAASLYRQLGQPAKAERYARQAARWRTPGWI